MSPLVFGALSPETIARVWKSWRPLSRHRRKVLGWRAVSRREFGQGRLPRFLCLTGFSLRPLLTDRLQGNDSRVLIEEQTADSEISHALDIYGMQILYIASSIPPLTLVSFASDERFKREYLRLGCDPIIKLSPTFLQRPRRLPCIFRIAKPLPQ